MSSDGWEGCAILEAIAGVCVGCVGDLMLDRFISGAVTRISPEAPVPVLRVEHETVMPGGAGNVVRNLLALGAEVRLAAVVGDDAAGEALTTLVTALPGVDANIGRETGRVTTEKTRLVAGTHQLLRTDRETTHTITAQSRAALLASVDVWLASCRALVLSDYAKGTLADGTAERLIARAAQAAIPVVVDPKGNNFGCYRGAAVVTPNRGELADAAGRRVVHGEEAAVAQRLAVDCGLSAVVVTLGAEGMLVVPAVGEAIPLPAAAHEVFDVSGAGDTVVATLAAALAVGASLATAAALANVAAGIAVAKVGTAAARADEIAVALRRQEVQSSDDKRWSVVAAAERAERWRRQGLKVGFANGCFDLLHPGHLSLLRQARAACDRLIVGLNSDASVGRLKGPGRPVQAEAARALVLASLAFVDAVVVFGDDTPIRLVEALRPDVLVKGADYRLEDIVGADLVQGYGGRVLLARLEPGFSTSATVSRIGDGP